MIFKLVFILWPPLILQFFRVKDIFYCDTFVFLANQKQESVIIINYVEVEVSGLFRNFNLQKYEITN